MVLDSLLFDCLDYCVAEQGLFHLSVAASAAHQLREMASRDLRIYAKPIWQICKIRRCTGQESNRSQHAPNRKSTHLHQHRETALKSRPPGLVQARIDPNVAREPGVQQAVPAAEAAPTRSEAHAGAKGRACAPALLHEVVVHRGVDTYSSVH